MRVINCVCGARVEAADGEDIVPVMVRHSDAAHPEMKFSEQQIRAMMTSHDSRVAAWDGSTQRIESPVEIRPLTPERSGDFLRFFDRDAFADNPAWSGCYCLFYNVEHGPDWMQRSAEDKRAEKEESIKSGRSEGYLAYLDGKVIGWCHGAPRSSLPGLGQYANDPDDPESDTTGAIVCFNIAPPYRGQGLAKKLLAAACEGLRERGMTAVTAIAPRDAPSAARAYHGTVSLYAGAGFSEHGAAGEFVVMRKPL